MEIKPIALTGGKLIDGTGADPVEDSVVLIDGKTISQVGNRAEVRLPEGCIGIDISGKTVMPGLIDLHVHLSFEQMNVSQDRYPLWVPGYLYRPLPWFGILCYANAKKAFEMGFTTLRDVGETIGEYSPIALRNAINSGIVQGPRIYASGPWLTTNCGHNGDTLPPWLNRKDIASEWIADGAGECLKAVRERIKMGADFIKIFGSGGIMDSYNHQEFNDEELAAIVGEAHSKGRRVAAHLEYPEGIKACVNAGVDSVEHGWVLTEEVVDLMIQKGVVMVPTIYAIWNLVHHGAEFGMPQVYIETAKNTMYEKALKSFKMAHEAGVKLAMGTDCGYYPCPQGTNAKELELMMEFCGMSAMEAIETTTKNGAEALGIGNKLGTLEAGKLADVLVVDGDPLVDITVLQKKENILLVMKGGEVFVERIHAER